MDSARSELGLTVAHEIDRICDTFERALRAGESPRIEDFLTLPAEARRPLLRALLIVDIDHRQELRQDWDERGLRARFPDDGSLLDEVRGELRLRETVSAAGETSQVADPDATSEAAPASAKPDPLAPLDLSDYALERCLGKGGQGEVYLARQRSLDRNVAVKLLHPTRDDQVGPVQRFIREARTLAQLRHPHIVTIHGIGKLAEGGYFLVMEYVAGADLAARLAREDFAFAEAARIVSDVADAVASAHECGVIHRDLKPSNVLWDERRGPVVTDFGLAKDLHAVDGLTLSEQLLGTPAYMAPEQADRRFGEVSERTDIYGLGALLFALLTRRTPYAGATVVEVLRRLTDDGPPPDPRTLRPDTPPELAQICLQCLAKFPAERLASAADLAEQLRRWLKGESADANPRPRRPQPFFVEPERYEHVPRDANEPAQPPIWDDNVQFSVYRPKAIAPERWERLLVFAHLSDLPPDAPPDTPDPVEEVRRQAEQVLGAMAPGFQAITADSAQAIPREGELTLVPSGEGLEFNPPRRTFRWVEQVHREEFRFRARAAMEGRRARGRLSIFLGSILIAEVNLVVQVVQRARGDEPVESTSNRAFRFRRIYASVAPEDEAIGEQFRRYAEAMHDTFLLSQAERRSAAIFDTKQQQLIRSADVFQLYWSRNAMKSAAMREEWEYALSLRRPDFVRPLYWEQPFPTAPERSLPPPGLIALGFHRIAAAPLAHAATEKSFRAESRSAAAAPYLEIASGPQQGRILRLDRERVALGRHPQCDLPLETTGASRFHAQLVREHGQWFVEDLQSRNGTFVNGARVAERVRLRDGDRIHVGDVVLLFQTSGDLPASAAVVDDGVESADRFPLLEESTVSNDNLKMRRTASEDGSALAGILSLDLDQLRELVEKDGGETSEADVINSASWPASTAGAPKKSPAIGGGEVEISPADREVGEQLLRAGKKRKKLAPRRSRSTGIWLALAVLIVLLVLVAGFLNWVWR